MRLDADTPLWVVTDATANSTLPDVLFETTLTGLRRQFLGGLDVPGLAVFSEEAPAIEEAKTRLLVRRVADQIRADRRLAADEVVRVTLHGEGGNVLGTWEVR